MSKVESVCKGDIAEILSERTGFTKKEASEAISTMFGIISESLVENKNVKIVGFGTFETKQIKARKGRNPKTGEPLDIPSSVKVKFSVGKSLKSQINE